MKSRLLILLIFSCLVIQAQKQEPEPKKGKSFGEKLGNFTGNLLTAKTDQLGNIAPVITLVSGIYDLRTNTSETKYYPEGTCEGDYAVSVSLFKQEGTGLLNLKGEVLCNGEPMDYIGLGSYLTILPDRVQEPVRIEIKAENGDQASFLITPVSEIEILSVNDDMILPIIDLNEDMIIEYSNPDSSERSTVYAGLLTDIMGVRAVNQFADFPAGHNRVTIPKETFSNLAISGKLNAGNINKGENFLILERQVKTEKSQLDPEQNPGNLPAVTIVAKAYASMPVVVKGRQEEGVITALNFSGKFSEEKIGFEAFKPNAQTGIPFSRGSVFGLASLTLKGRLYHKETHSSTSEWTVGNTRYTQTTTWTTILEFPQLDDIYWDNMLSELYRQVTNLFQERFGISFTDVSVVTGTSQYHTLFTDAEVNSYTRISRTYQGTRRMQPRSLGEVLSNISSAKSSETPLNMMMREAGVDGLLSMDINLDIAADKKNRVVLIPSINFSIIGTDEQKDYRNGTYANGTIRFISGIPFNEEVVGSDPNSLVMVCNENQMITCMDYMLTNLQAKEIELGFDKIWSIGE